MAMAKRKLLMIDQCNNALLADMLLIVVVLSIIPLAVLTGQTVAQLLQFVSESWPATLLTDLVVEAMWKLEKKLRG